MVDKDALKLISQTDVFLPNAIETCALFGLAETEIQRAAALLAKLDCISVIKCGADGAGIATKTGLELTPSPKTDVVDTTGAGDAFNAGFLHAWLAGAPPETCLKQGVECGSRAVSQSGGAFCLT